MRKTMEFFVMLIIVCCIYGIVILIFQNTDAKGSVPVISTPQDVLEISVKDDEDVILEGVKAEDQEDGILDDSVFVESISSFDEDQCRTVTYAVFDSDDNLAQATRKIKYTDYEAPKITLKKALYSAYSDASVKLTDYVGATSSVDGDISGSVTVSSDTEDTSGNVLYPTFQVTDSCGTTVKLRFKIDILDYDPVINIELKDYLIYVKKGTKIDPKDYIDEISERNIKDNSLMDRVQIQDNYNADEPGVYEFVYRIERSNGDSGYTKLIVVVEE